MLESNDDYKWFEQKNPTLLHLELWGAIGDSFMGLLERIPNIKYLEIDGD